LYHRIDYLSAISNVQILSATLQVVLKDIEKDGGSAEDLAKTKETASAKVLKLKEQMAQLKFDQGEFNMLDKEKRELQSAVVELSDAVEALQAQLGARLSFEYKDPVRGFDRTKVKGLVANLVEIKDMKHATAIEVVAGSRLFQVVVDEAITGKALLERGQLQRRVTIIPLDKISPRPVSQSACDTASKIAATHQATSEPGTNLIEFDEQVRSAMEYTFGSSLVVDNAKAADEICSQTKTRCVTLDGDVFESNGTISGGSVGNLGKTLLALAELATKTQELKTQSSQLNEVTARLKGMEAGSSMFDKLSGKVELAEAELDAAKKHLSNTCFGMLVEKREYMSKQLEEAEAECVAMQAEKERKWELYEQLKEQETELTNKREERIVEMELAIKVAKAKVAETEKRARDVSLAWLFSSSSLVLLCILVFTDCLHCLISRPPGRPAVPDSFAGA
jgi:structural maintenance of chromosome 2